MTLFYCLKAYKGEGSTFLEFNVTHYVKEPLRMLRPGGKIVPLLDSKCCRKYCIVCSICSSYNKIC